MKSSTIKVSFFVNPLVVRSQACQGLHLLSQHAPKWVVLAGRYAVCGVIFGLIRPQPRNHFNNKKN